MWFFTNPRNAKTYSSTMLRFILVERELSNEDNIFCCVCLALPVTPSSTASSSVMATSLLIVFLLSVWQVDVLPIVANRRVEDSAQRRMTTTFCCHGNWQCWLISPSYMAGRGFAYISLKGTHFHDIKKASPSVLVVPWLFPNINNIYCWTFS